MVGCGVLGGVVCMLEFGDGFCCAGSTVSLLWEIGLRDDRYCRCIRAAVAISSGRGLLIVGGCC